MTSRKALSCYICQIPIHSHNLSVRCSTWYLYFIVMHIIRCHRNRFSGTVLECMILSSFIGGLAVQVNLIITFLVYLHIKGQLWFFYRGSSTWNMEWFLHTRLWSMRRNGPPPITNVICYMLCSDFSVNLFGIYNINGQAWDIPILIWKWTDGGSRRFLNWTQTWIIECFKHTNLG
jgi:hypothetical protein